MAFGYDKNKDYKALMNEQAAKGNYSSAAISEAQRNEKIDKEGLSYDKTYDYSSYLPSTNTSSSGNYTPLGSYNDYGMGAEDKKAIESIKQQWENAKAAGDAVGMANANAGANAIRAKYGYSGGVDGSQYIKLDGVEASTPTTPFSYTNYDDFYKQSGYSGISDSQKAANEYYLQQVLNNMGTQKGKLNQAADKQAGQAYTSYMLSQKALPQQLAAKGYNGGIADSQRIALDSNFQNTRNDIEQNRLNALNDIETNMNNARLESYGKLADQNAALAQAAISAWNNYTNNANQMANTNFWNNRNFEYQKGRDAVTDDQWQKSFDQSNKQFDMNYGLNERQVAIQEKNPYYAYVMDKIGKGNMPTQEELVLAGLVGISPEELVQTYKQYANLDLNPG